MHVLGHVGAIAAQEDASVWPAAHVMQCSTDMIDKFNALAGQNIAWLLGKTGHEIPASTSQKLQQPSRWHMALLAARAQQIVRHSTSRPAHCLSSTLLRCSPGDEFVQLRSALLHQVLHVHLAVLGPGKCNTQVVQRSIRLKALETSRKRVANTAAFEQAPTC